MIESLISDKLQKIVFGQLISILSVLNGLACVFIENSFNLRIPLLLTFTYYCFLSLLWLYKSDFKLSKLKTIYFLIALIDSQANFINVYAFTIVQFEYPFIINFLSVIWTIILTYLFIKKYTYTKIQKSGLVISFVGITLTLFCNISLKEINIHFIKGFIYCFITSILYSVNSILIEKFLDTHDEIFNYFPWIGIIGGGISFIQGMFFGEIQIFFNFFTINAIWMWIVFIITLVSITSISPFFIQKCGASMFNFSLASNIFWSMTIDLLVNYNSSIFHFGYLFGFMLVIIGLLFFYSNDLITNRQFEPKIELIRERIKNDNFNA